MIVRCNQKCRLSDGTTSASLDVDENRAICDQCGEELTNVSSYSKISMRKNGDILRSKNRKAFMFPCLTCERSVEATTKMGVVVGRLCENEQKGCKIDITEHMVCAIENSEIIAKKIEDIDE
jgi:hypothetical protein